MYEIINTYSYYGKKTDKSYDWLIDESSALAQCGKSFYNDDYALIGNVLRPFLLRGGNWWNGSPSGVFASRGGYGEAINDFGFRPVLVVQ